MAEGTSLESALNGLYQAALPPVDRKPVDRLPATLYRYVIAVSANQQIRLCLLTVLVFPLSMIPLELQRRIVDTAVEARDFQIVLAFAALYLAVLLLHGGLKFARNLYLGRTAEGVIRLLRRRVCDYPDEDVELEPGARVSLMASETEKIGGFVAESLSQPLLNGGVLLTVAIYMMVVEPLVALVALAFFVPSVILAPLLQAAVNRRAQRRTRLMRGLGDLMVGEGVSEDDAETLIERIYGIRIAIFALKNLQKFVTNLMGHLGPLAVLTVGGWLVVEGRAEVGTIVAFISGFERMNDPARQLFNFYRQLSQTKVQYKLVRDAVPVST